MNIWDLAREKLKESEAKAADLDEKLDTNTTAKTATSQIRLRKESVALICGSRQCGKTTFLHKYLERNEEPKATIGLDYLFGRRTRGKVKDLCNIYELGGGIKLTNLLSIPLNSDNIEITSLILILDLTKPYDMWDTLDGIVSSVKKEIARIHQFLSQNNPTALQRLSEVQSDRLKAYGEQLRLCSPLGIPFMIIGSKYDEFQNLESEQRRHICQFLRFVSFYYGGSLMFYSSRMESLIKTGRAMFSHYALETTLPKTIVSDHNKPLVIPVGMDSFQDIGAPPMVENSFARASQPIELWREAFNSLFPPKETNGAGEDPTFDPVFKEPVIDKLIEQKLKDLEMYQKQKKDRLIAEEKAKTRIVSM
ncbi:unnamed protein product [Auanema sp. JU1783]|nr:unnamed protein product [Auanema sp. JU1783]